MKYDDTSLDIFDTPIQDLPVAETVVFEQPLNDSMRICLRLEHLFSRISTFIEKPEPSDSRVALTAILEVLNAIDRPDFKSRLTQTLTQAQSTLNTLLHAPNVDQDLLQDFLSRINQGVSNLSLAHGKIGGALRQNEFLNTIRLNLSNPGGACPFNSAAFHLWLHRPSRQRIDDLNTWLKEIAGISEIASSLLKFNRESTAFRTVNSRNGFYQDALDATSPYDLLRIKLNTDVNIYPEFSVGRHRMSIRFLIPLLTGEGRAEQYREPLDFELACCRI